MSYTKGLRIAEGLRSVAAAWRRLARRRSRLPPVPTQVPTAFINALVLLALYATNAAATIPASERAVLLDLYESTNGAHWTRMGRSPCPAPGGRP